MFKKTKEAPYHGRNILRWCDQKSCNIPILRGLTCPHCGHETRKVTLAPPFDVRPAFNTDILSIRKTIEQLFGETTGAFMAEKLVLLNASSYLDRQDEVILDGLIVGLFRYDLTRSRFEFHPKIPGALYIWNTDAPKQRWIKVDRGAAPHIAQGKNVLAPGVLDFDESIEAEDPVIVVSHDDQVLATGIAKESANQLYSKTKGMIVKAKDCVSRYQSTPKRSHSSPFKSWNDIAKLHESYLQTKEQEAIKFIRWAIKKYSLPVTVAFSGGKDSLVTLNLVRKATEDFSILYMDTGLELPETTFYVYKVLRELGLLDTLITRRTDPQIFWDTAVKLGPPGVDFRWCCKTSKLGPLNTMIKDQFHQCVLSFVGQRRYESQARAKATKIWRNPWVSNQIGVSPIKEWTALDIWLYITWKELSYNPLYNQGYSRVGCWLCPASKMAHFTVLQQNHEELWRQLMTFLKNHKRTQDLPDEWLLYGLWRWKEPPSKFQHLLEKTDELVNISKSVRPIEVYFSPSITPCVSGPIILKGKISSPATKDFVYLADLLNPFGSVKVNETLGILIFENTGFNFKFFENGRFYFDFESFDSVVRTQAILVMMLIIRGLECTGCGACLGSCPSHALHIKNHKIWIDTDCKSCMKCFNVCPILTFGYSHLEERISQEIDQILANVKY